MRLDYIGWMLPPLKESENECRREATNVVATNHNSRHLNPSDQILAAAAPHRIHAVLPIHVAHAQTYNQYAKQAHRKRQNLTFFQQEVPISHFNREKVALVTIFVYLQIGPAQMLHATTRFSMRTCYLWVPQKKSVFFSCYSNTILLP